MSVKRRVNGGWVICLVAGLWLASLPAVSAGEVSRAVEVAPPKGWTPETPLFDDEAPVRAQAPGAVPAATAEATTAPKSPRPARRLVAASKAPVPADASTKGSKVVKTEAKAVKSERLGKVARTKPLQGSRAAARGKPTARASVSATARKGTMAPRARGARPSGASVARAPKAQPARGAAAGARHQARPPKAAAQVAGKRPAQAKRAAKRVPAGAQAGVRGGRRTGVKKS